MPYNLLIALLNSPQTKSKKELLASQLKSITREQAIECFTILRMNNLLTVFEGKRPQIIVNDTNTKILKIMKTNKWISSFSVDRDNSSYYRVNARRKQQLA